jgi:hypothetical protein
MNEKSFSKKKLIKEYFNFDWKSYIDTYDDLQFIVTKEDAWYHWINYGKHEGRLINNVINDKEFKKFNWKSYITHNEDLAYIKTKEEAWKHWVTYGKHENRIIDHSVLDEEFINFDWEMYINKYEDLSYIKTKEDAWRHWIQHGKNENRFMDELNNNEDYKNFNWETYVSNYDDLLYIESKEEAWKHWINYGKNENRICENIFLFDDYKTFNWKKYINNYDDLTYIDSEAEAWRHFVLYGFNEGRKLNDIKEIELNELKKLEENEDVIKDVDFSINKIYFKNKYTNCGKHFFGWKSSMDYLLENYKFNNSNFNKKYYFDEWIEKLLVWGNKLQSEKYLKIINEENLQLITFLHGPPNEGFDFETINKDLILNDISLLNKNIMTLITNNNLLYNITFLYVLSIHHKNYIVNTYPQFKNKVLSLYHPIDIHNCEKDDMFNIRKFMNKKNIYHIGWWLRNFTTFIKFNPPRGYNKLILLKQDFANQFNEKFTNIDKKIQIVNELQDSEYKKIFSNSCIFCDMTDAVANNVVLECIKFNTPIIIRRISSIEEYLGVNYPLFFNDTSELNKLKDPTIFHKKILEATQYLQKMNKTPFMLETFLDKISYDVNKLKINNDQCKLTWLYYLNSDEYDVEKYISIFRKQLSIENIKLIIINSLETKISLLEKYSSDNITIINVEPELGMNEIYDIFVNASTTEYLTFKNFSDEENYSDLCINYLENNPTFDVVIFKNNQDVIKKSVDKAELKTHDEEMSDSSVSSHINNVNAIDAGENSDSSSFIQENDDRNEPNEITDLLSEGDEISVFTDVSNTSQNEKIFDLEENDKTQEIDVIDDSIDIVNEIDSVSEETELENKCDEEIIKNNNENLLTYSQVCDYNFNDQNINILWRKSIHSYIRNFDEKFWIQCYKNHLNIFEIQYNNKIIIIK